MSEHEKFNKLIDYIVSHLWDYKNTIFKFDDIPSKSFKLDAIYNKQGTIFFRDTITDELIEFNLKNLPALIYCMTYDERVY